MYYGNDPELKTKYEELSNLVNAAYEALSVAERYADEHKLSFTWSGGGYGMGGWYEGDPDQRDSAYSGWSASSHSC